MFNGSPDAFARGFIPFCQRALRHFQIARDHSEQIVEIVRDSAGQLTDGLQLLGVVEHGFGFPPLLRLGLKHGVGQPQLAGDGIESNLGRSGQSNTAVTTEAMAVATLTRPSTP